MQGGKKLVIKNAIFLAAARYINLITNGLLTIFLARFLDVSSFGKYVTIYSFLFFGNILANFGIPPIIVRNVAKDHNLKDEFFSNSIYIVLVFSIIAYVIIAITSWLMYKDFFLRVLILIALLGLFPTAISSILSAFFRAYEKMQIPSVVGMYISFASFFTILLILFLSSKKLLFIILANVIFSLIQMVVLIKKLREKIEIKFLQPKLSLCISILKQSFAVASIRIFNLINQRIDVLMLSVINSMTIVGYYGIPIRLIKIVNVPFNSLSMALLPRISAQFNRKNLKNIYKQAQQFYFLLSLLISLIIFIFAKEIIALLFGHKYIVGNSHLALRILILAFFVNKISGPAGVVILSSEEKLNKFIPFAFLGAVLNIILNLFWIPRYGILGASWATLICALVMCTIKLFLVRGVLKNENLH